MIPVLIVTGVGMWTASKRTTLVACPHVGDNITVGEITLTCDVVFIGETEVEVRDTSRFESEEALRRFAEGNGWTL